MGVEIGDTSILIYARPMCGRRYILCKCLFLNDLVPSALWTSTSVSLILPNIIR